jgi:hypothetical protein
VTADNDNNSAGEMFVLIGAGVKPGEGNHASLWLTFRGEDGMSHSIEFYIQHSDQNIQHTGQWALSVICDAAGLREIEDTDELVGREYIASTIAKVRSRISRHARFLNPIKEPAIQPSAKAFFQDEPQPDARYVYVISCVDAKENYCKIGIAKSPEKRLKELSTSSPHTLRLEFARFCGNARRVEVKSHEHFADHRKNGEWFSMEPTKAISFVNDNIDRMAA